MFFGSGNLVFPLQVGVESEGHYFIASLGVLATCVLFPLLGMLGMMLYRGDLGAFFSCFGPRGTFLFSLVCLGLMGPFGVLARCLTVIHGALSLLVPNVTLWVTSLAMCLLIYLLTVNKSRIVSIVGSYLTPFLLLSIGAIVFFALYGATLEAPVSGQALSSFTNGFFQGYQTMDLVASFFFAHFVLAHLAKQEKSGTSFFLKSSLIAAALLYAVYYALVLLGWLYASELRDVPSQEMFGRVAMYALGSYGAPFVCLAVILACLTTAIALTSLFAEFLHKEVSGQRLAPKWTLLVTLGCAFCVSCLEFSGIARFLNPILDAIYPALIVLTVVNIGLHYYGLRTSHWPFTVTVLTKLCWV